MNDETTPALNTLRETAEQKLKETPPFVLPDTPDVLKHELSVHQIELELQNQQLREANMELQRTQDRYVELYDHAPVGYFTLDDQGIIREANVRTTRLLEMERSRLLGRRLSQFTAPESRTLLAMLLPRLLASAEVIVAELHLQRADGSSFPVRLEGRTPASGGCLIAMTDITTEKNAQAELLHLNETLEQRVRERTAKMREVNDELKAVTLSISEDLMVPLRRVSSLADVLRRDGLTSSGTHAEHFSHVFRSVDRLEELAHALLEYTRASQTRVRLAPLDLNRVFQEVAKDVRPRMQGRTVHLTHDALPVVLSDSSAMQLVFFKVLDNALKFTETRSEARIHVSAQESESEFIVRFTDNGVGFNNRHRDKLFQIFKRLHPESAFPGAGMGLAIVRRVCGRFGARVWAEGKVDGGATFFIGWPKQPTLLE
ncbi:sensor histidine kinase [Deinococcus yavapaiensis]|uniref:histidine kinase n=1 Tax=Deinococcus yavapaiensis KR-236 TaxID=694435 RepID=A0A318S6A1_9DEIO|nr:ATP-binding protein [Deinococcus yavapaiensis]PYE50009.1 PAS domain S-box-containing protein [Deinococcus yavapaiensis KR-236]